MALFHLSVTQTKRSAGQSAIAFLRRQGENHAQRNVGAFGERNHRFIQHFREPGKGKDLRAELAPCIGYCIKKLQSDIKK